MLSILQSHAFNRPHAVAISNEQSSLTFGELSASIGAVARFFARESSSLVVYIALPSGPEFTAVQIGVIESGNIAVPLPHKLTSSEAARFFSMLKPDVLCISSLEESPQIVDSLDAATQIVVLKSPTHAEQTKAVFGWRDIMSGTGCLPIKQAGKAPLPPGTSMVQFTSGSTGWPKAILLNKGQLLANQRLSGRHLAQFNQMPVFIPVPQFHAMGNALVIEHLLAGSPTHLANSQLHGDHLRRLVQIKATAIQASPNYFRMLLRMSSFSPDLLPDLRSVTIGSDWIDDALIVDLRKRFGALSIFCRYGLSEAFGALGYNTISAGPDTYYENGGVKFLDEVFAPTSFTTASRSIPAALKIRSPTAASHQLLHTGEVVSLFDEEGFLNTGDLVFQSETGNLILAGRESQFIKYNGYRISPYEVEEVLRKSPGVSEAFVTGIPDPTTGQRIVACITVSDQSPPSVHDLRKFCATHLSPYKAPQAFEFNFRVPKTASGKVARSLFTQQLSDFFKAKENIR